MYDLPGDAHIFAGGAFFHRSGPTERRTIKASFFYEENPPTEVITIADDAPDGQAGTSSGAAPSSPPKPIKDEKEEPDASEQDAPETEQAEPDEQAEPKFYGDSSCTTD